MSRKNYIAHGGRELVIGGKLTFLPGATVEGAEGLLDLPPTDAVVLQHIPDSTATTVSALRADFNRLLAAMRTAGVMVTDILPPELEDGQ